MALKLCTLPSRLAVHSPSTARATALLTQRARSLRASLTPGSLERCPLLARQPWQGDAASAGASVDFGTSGHPGTGNFTARETLTPFVSLACPRSTSRSYIYSGHFFQGCVSTHEDHAGQGSKHTVPGSPATPTHRAAPHWGSAQRSLTHRCAPLRLQALSAVLEHRAAVTGFLNAFSPSSKLQSHPLQILPPTHRTLPL